MLILLLLKKLMRKQRNLINHDSSFLKKQVHTLAIFSQHSYPEEPLENLLWDHIKTIGQCTTPMENLNDMLKELIGEYGDDE